MTRDVLQSLHGSVAAGSLTDWSIETEPFLYSLGFAKCVPTDGYKEWEVWCDFCVNFVRFTIKYNGGKVHEDSIKAKSPESDSEALELIADHVIPLVEHHVNTHLRHFAESHNFSYGDEKLTPAGVEGVQTALPGWDVKVCSGGDLYGTLPSAYFKRIEARARRGEDGRYPGEFLRATLEPSAGMWVVAAFKKVNHTGKPGDEEWSASYEWRINGRLIVHHVPLIRPPSFAYIEQAARHVAEWYAEKVKPELHELHQVYGIKITESFFDYADPKPDTEMWRKVTTTLVGLGYYFDDGSGSVSHPWRYYKKWGSFALSPRRPDNFSNVRTILNVMCAPLREGWHAMSQGRLDGLGAYEMTSNWASAKDWRETKESMDEILHGLKRWDEAVALRLSRLEQQMD